jgi:hypothetical protein
LITLLPGTQQYRDAYPIADNILSYQPPQLGLPQVTYSNPLELALIEYAMGGGEGGENEEPEDDNDDDSEEVKGGQEGEGGGYPDGSIGDSSSGGEDTGNSAGYSF